MWLSEECMLSSRGRKSDDGESLTFHGSVSRGSWKTGKRKEEEWTWRKLDGADINGLREASDPKRLLTEKSGQPKPLLFFAFLVFCFRPLLDRDIVSSSVAG